MDALLEYLYVKRFSLSCNYSNLPIEKSTCQDCNNYNHICCLYRSTNHVAKANIVSIGINKIHGDHYLQRVHAECDAILKLKKIRRKKPVCLNLLVIRISSTKKLQTSKCCQHCIQLLKKMPLKKGYKIKNVYYSMQNEIVKTTLLQLEKEEVHCSRRLRT